MSSSSRRVLRERRSSRMTPYSATNRKSSTNANSLVENTIASEDSMESSLVTTQLAVISTDILYKTWKMHRITQLWKFDYSASHLRNYSRLLTIHMKASMEEGRKDVPDGVVKSKLTVCDELSIEGSPKAVKIVISLTKQNKEASLLIAYLCCMSRGVNVIPGFTCLPLLLIKAFSAVSKKFLNWLRVKFDCFTTHLTLYGPELRYLMTQCVVGSGGHKVIAIYTSPAEIKEAGLSEVTLELSASDTAAIMSHLEHTSDDQIGSEFLNLMESDFVSATHITLERFTLSQFVTSIVSLDKNGRIKLAQADKVHGILTILTALISATE